MDGNGRWATHKGLKRTEGHREGVKTAKKIVLATKQLGIPYLSLYTFSKENWKRAKEEVSFLMNLIAYHFKKEFDFYIKNNIKIIHIGDKDGLPNNIIKIITKAEEESKNLSGLTLLLALNYSGKYDIIQAIKRIVNDGLDSKDIDETIFNSYLLTTTIPDPDLIIRTSGEFRISNYFLWQAAYSEFFVIDKYWPDFTEEDLIDIVNKYGNRERRFGAIKPSDKKEK